LPGRLQVGKVQVGKDLVKERAAKLGEKRLVDLSKEISGLGV
jgi:phospholipase A-2-activating protein